MARVAGTKNRTPFILDPEEALRVGARLDAMLRVGQVQHPRGIFRGPHAYLNALDEQRSLAAARRLNAA